MSFTDQFPELSKLYGTKSSGAFVVYRLPGMNEKVLLSGDVSYLSDNSTVNNGREGFIMAPFSGDFPILWLEAKEVSRYAAEDLFELPLEDYPMPLFHKEKFKEVSQQEYTKQIEKIKSMIMGGSAGKVVLSRQIIISLNKDFNTLNFFHFLCSLYPDAFVYQIYIPGFALWTGATPEILLSYRDQKLKTMALAGTRRAGSEGIWRAKDEEEHAFVVDYILGRLKDAGCETILKSEPCSVTAGRAMHLRTDFNAICKSGRIADLINMLHPTPAVCGWPANKALEIIKSVEKHERSYYTGYLGPVGSATADLFVNLRCMQLFNRKAVIYTGGGLTSSSDPREEWDETVLKSTTMLSAIEKMRNLAV